MSERWSGLTAIVLASVAVGLLPHPPAGAPFLPKLTFFFLTGLIFSTMAYFTNSILPSIPVHAIGLLVFFVLIWPNDPSRRLVGSDGADLWFWAHVTQSIVFAALAIWAFRRLALTTSRHSRSTR